MGWVKAAALAVALSLPLEKLLSQTPRFIERRFPDEAMRTTLTSTDFEQGDLIVARMESSISGAMHVRFTYRNPQGIRVWEEPPIVHTQSAEYAILATDLLYPAQQAALFVTITSEHKQVHRAYPVEIYRRNIRRSYLPANTPNAHPQTAQDTLDMLREQAEPRAMREQQSMTPFFLEGIALPSHCEQSGFGSQRYQGGKPLSTHEGTDCTAREGEPVRAVLGGIVAITDEHYFGCGKTVIIDSGKGIYTTYCHLSSIDVTQGTRVRVDRAIGLVGSTGHSTSPHLHIKINADNRTVSLYSTQALQTIH